jgi:hypothetical protein
MRPYGETGTFGTSACEVAGAMLPPAEAVINKSNVRDKEKSEIVDFKFLF